MADKPLTDEELNARHRQMADAFIDQANQLTGDNNPENVGMALLFAASRYNAYVVSKHAETLEAFESELSRAKAFFTGHYQEMLDENLEDYKRVYDKYAHLMKSH